MNETHKKTSAFKTILKFLLPTLLVVGGAGVAVYFLETRPQMHRVKTAEQVPLVEVLEAKTTEAPVVVKGQGTVEASQEVTLEPEVDGRVVAIAAQFLPGGLITKDEEVVNLDKKEYEIDLYEAKSNYESKRADLEIEYGQQKVVKEVFKSLDESAKTPMLETKLVLREPNLKQAIANLDVEKAAVDMAQLNVDRTVIKAPFNGLITKREVSVGSNVSAHEELGTIVSTDAYWIEVAVPIDRLQHIDFSLKGGAPVKVYSQTSNGEWNGHVLRLTGTLADSSRLAMVLVEVKDPLGLDTAKKGPPLLIGDYVRVEIQGKPVQNVVKLPRTALRMDDTVWIAHNGSLDIRKVGLAWKGDDNVLVSSGLVQGDKVVLSDLSSSVQGMKLTVREEQEKKVTAMGADSPEKTAAPAAPGPDDKTHQGPEKMNE